MRTCANDGCGASIEERNYRARYCVDCAAERLKLSQRRTTAKYSAGPKGYALYLRKKEKRRAADPKAYAEKYARAMMLYADSDEDDR